MSDNNQEKSTFALIFANLLLRLWIALRMIAAGVDKFRAGAGDTATFNMDNYKTKMGNIAKLTYEKGFLPKNLCDLYAQPIGFILIGVGVWVLLGLFTELGLLAAGLTFLSLAIGLATLPDDTEVVLIGVHILIVAAALATNKANKISLDGLLFRKRNDD